MTPLESFSRTAVEVVSARLLLGRQFRTFFEFSIPSGQSAVIRFQSGSDFVLQSQSLNVTSGGVRFAAVVNATESGVFGSALPVVSKNRTTSHRVGPDYVTVADITSGGQISSGTEVEVIRVSGTSSGGHATTVSGAQNNHRMLPAGVYYLKLENTDNSTSTGVYMVEWEEL